MHHLIEMRRPRWAPATLGPESAVVIKSAEDIPQECRAEFRRSCGKHGTPILAFFSSAIARSIIDCAPRVVLLFGDVMHVITPSNETRGTTTLEVLRSRVLGYGIAEFVLDDWFTLYYGVQASTVAMIPFGGCAAGLYCQLGRSLWAWLERGNGESHARRSVLSFGLPARLPLRFTEFLQSHPEIRLGPDSVFQLGLAVSRSHRPFWPSLLLAISGSRLVVISDQYDDYPSASGVEATCLSLHAVNRVAWIDRSILRHARIAIDVEQQGRSLQFSWPASPQFESTALNWIEWANSILMQARLYTNSIPEPSPTAMQKTTNHGSSNSEWRYS